MKFTCRQKKKKHKQYFSLLQ